MFKFTNLNSDELETCLAKAIEELIKTKNESSVVESGFVSCDIKSIDHNIPCGMQIDLTLYYIKG